jgi:hypothetical protein
VGVITIHVCNARSGEVVSTNVPDDIPIPDILQLLDNRYRIGVAGRPEQFVLYNISQRFEYEPTDTLAARSTARGDLSIVVNASRCPNANTAPE